MNQPLSKSRNVLYNLKKETPDIVLFPLMLILAVVPLIVHLKVISLSGSAYLAWTGSKVNLDYFSWYKGIVLLAATVSGLLIALFYKRFRPQYCPNRDWKIYWPIGCYALFVLLSTLFAEHRQIALWGFPDRYEGTLILLCYISIFWLASYWVSSEKQLVMLILSLAAGAYLIGLLGMGQFLGIDFWRTTIGKWLVLPSQYFREGAGLTFFVRFRSIYASLYQYDFVGSYMAMLFPLFTTLFIFEKRRKYTLLFGLLMFLMSFSWLGCTSRAGLFGGCVALLLLIILTNSKLRQRKWLVILEIIIIVTQAVWINSLLGGYLFKRTSSFVQDSGTLVGILGPTDTIPKEPLKDIKINGQTASVTTIDGTINLSLNGKTVSFFDKAGKPIPLDMPQFLRAVTFTDPMYEKANYQLTTLNGKNVVVLTDQRVKLFFGIDGGKFELLDFKGTPVPLKPAASWGFSGHKQFLGSSRGYIWSRSIPLLKDTLLLGHGPDTFPFYFPQYDLKGKLYALGTSWVVVDKPHDFYLQTAINTGVLSLISLLVLFLGYWFSSFRLYFRHSLDSISSRIGTGILAAVTGYLIAAFFNDSLVSVAPVFWILLGMGFAANRIVKNQDRAESLD